jgi:hypothetical protein
MTKKMEMRSPTFSCSSISSYLLSTFFLEYKKLRRLARQASQCSVPIKVRTNFPKTMEQAALAMAGKPLYFTARRRAWSFMSYYVSSSDPSGEP